MPVNVCFYHHSWYAY